MEISVLGAGTMGHGIAQVSAMAGHSVTLRDIDEEIIDSGLEAIEENLSGAVELEKISAAEKSETLKRISGTTSLEEAVSGADLVIEAAPERLDLKQEIFTDLEALVSDETILATNTSSLSITDIASVLDQPERSIGLHFFNPVHIMGLVEVVVAEQTGSETVSFAEEFVDEIDKIPVVVNDRPGFASSRLGVSLGVEAARMVEEGVANVSDIDAAMRHGYNHPVGPLELTDMVGLDIRLHVLEYLHDELGERFRPPQILKQKVRAGKLGKKTGEGFYVWKDGEPHEIDEGRR